jgi:predicted esterase
MSSDRQTKASLLFLHGYGQSIAHCKKHNEHLFRRLSNVYDLHFTEGQYAAGTFRPEEKSWWPTDDVLGDILSQKDVVSDELVQSLPGPVDVLMGFSQGGNLVMHCLERRPEICKVAVICSGLRGAAFRQCNIVTTPVVAVFGEKDQFINEEIRQNLLEVAPNAKVIIHQSGHCIPQSAKFVQELQNAINDVIKVGC